MVYATIADLLQAATGGWDELAQRAALNALVDGQLMQATVEGTERAAWTAPAVEAADAALLRINDALARASAHADTYMFPRYRTVMPLAAELVAGSSLPAAVAAIALKRLYGHLVPEEVRKGTQWADDYLRDLSKGVVSLGGLDATVAQPAGHMVSRAQGKAFDWGSY